MVRLERVVITLLFVVGLASVTVGVRGQEPDVESARVLRQLSAPVDLEFDQQPLPDVISFLSMVGGVEFANPEVLPKKAIVKLKARGISLHSVLSLALLPTEFVFRVRAGKVVFLEPKEIQKADLEPAGLPSSKVRKQLRALKRAKTEFEFEGGDVRKFVAFLQSHTTVSIVIHDRAVKAAGIRLDQKKVAAFDYDGKLLGALDKVLEPHGLAVVHRHEVLLVTSRADAKRKPEKSGRPGKGGKKSGKVSSQR